MKIPAMLTSHIFPMCAISLHSHYSAHSLWRKANNTRVRLAGWPGLCVLREQSAGRGEGTVREVGRERVRPAEFQVPKRRLVLQSDHIMIEFSAPTGSSRSLT